VPSKQLTLLVDSASLIYRAYFAVPATVRAPNGTQVNAAHGFINMLARLIAELHPTRLACAWDDDWRPQWRVDLVDSYKAHRVAAGAGDTDETIDEQMELIAELLSLAGVAVVGAEGYEAEDVIGSLVKRVRGSIAIVSGDRDLFQLVRDPDVRVLYPVRGVSELATIDEAQIEARYGIPGRSYGDFAVLRGDPSDGLPGVPGIGQKTAATLIRSHGNLKGVVAAARKSATGPLGKVAASLDYIARAERVVRIASDAPVGEADLRLPLHAPDPKLEALGKKSGLGGAIGRLVAALG
jgi:5'-3' exonuclease